MLSMGRLGNGQGKYYTDLAAEDYYVRGGEPEGLWLQTAGARFLRLNGTVSKEEFHSLFRGYKADGTPLVQNAGKEDRCPGNDLTFSAPKSVSVYWAMAPAGVRQTIQQCQLDAVTCGIQYLEREASFSRRGKGGCHLEHAGIVVAAFDHCTSRALDPQLHTHAIVLNIATRADGTTGALESKPLYEHKMAAGAIYRAQLAHLLQERLGLETVRERTSFEIARVPNKLCEYFSKRRAEIVKRLGEKAMESASAAAVAAIETREPKDVVPPRSELLAQWQQVGARFGFTLERAEALLHRVHPRNDPAHVAKVLDIAVKNALRMSFSFDRRALLREALCGAVQYGIDADTVRRGVDRHLNQATDIVRVAGPDDNPRYTTFQAIHLQKTIAQSVEKMHSSRVIPVSAGKVVNAIAYHLTQHNRIADELRYHVTQFARAAFKEKTWVIDRDCIARRAQRTIQDKHIPVIEDVTCSKRGRITAITGTSADDRYLVLSCCREAWQRAHHKVVGVSLSNDGVKRLYQETGIESMSLKRLELMMHPSAKFLLKFHLRQLWRAAREMPTYALEPLKITKDTVLVVDGAEKLSCQQMAALTRDVAKQGGRLVLVEGERKNNKTLAATPLDEISTQLARLKEEEERRSKSQTIENEAARSSSQSQGFSRSM